jgi:hypothetical protein
MSIEKQNQDPSDDLRRLIYGEEFATPQEIKGLETAAHDALAGSPTAILQEVFYESNGGYLTFCINQEDDTDPESTGVTYSIHAGDTEDPYISLSYNADNLLIYPVLSGRRSTEENIFHAVNIMQGIMSDPNLEPELIETAVFQKILDLIRTISNPVGDQIPQTPKTESVSYLDAIRAIVKQKSVAEHHIREICQPIGENRVISVIDCVLVPVDDSVQTASLDQYPSLQINLTDTASGMLSFYLAFASGNKVGDRAPLHDNDDAIDDAVITEATAEKFSDQTMDEADSILADSKPGISKELIHELTAAVFALTLANADVDLTE